MKSENVFLRSDILVEPLFNQWYAWPNLIPPASAAMYTANAHLRIMRSFVSAPQIHRSALKNPAMRGGPFINHEASRSPEIKALLEETTQQQAHMLKLAEAIKQLDEILMNEAKGDSLETIYAKVPDILKGYVELVYDLHNNPSMRLIEGLLYTSKYYDVGSQSLSLSHLTGDDRSFVFSTPRLRDDQHLVLKVPFSYGGLDELFKMKYAPGSYERISDVLGMNSERDDLFSSFFTEEEAAACSRYEGEQVRIRYFGHACILIESKAVSILCDPVISYKNTENVKRFVHTDLPPQIDYVLITHNHQDHVMFETLIQLRHKIRNIIVPKNSGGNLADPSLKLILRHTGFTNVYDLDEMETISLENGHITGLPFFGEHGDLNVRTKMAYLVNLEGKSMIMAADSNNLEPRLYEHIHEIIGDLDILFLGMECDGAPMSWLYGPLLTQALDRKHDQSRRLNGSTYERGIAMVNILKPTQVFIYAMGQEPWLTFLTSIRYTDESRPIIDSGKLVADCQRRGVPAEMLYIQREILL